MMMKTAKDFQPGQPVAIARKAQTWFKGDSGVVVDVDRDNNLVAVEVEGRTRKFWPGYLTVVAEVAQ